MFRARPHPGPALSPPAGQLAPRVGGQQGAACQDRAQRHRDVSYIGLVPAATSGHHNVVAGYCSALSLVAPGSAQERPARGGAAAAVLGRYGGGCVAMACGSVASGGRRCGPQGAGGWGSKSGECEAAEGSVLSFSAFIVRGDVACLVFFFGGETSSRTSDSESSESTGSEV